MMCGPDELWILLVNFFSKLFDLLESVKSDPEAAESHEPGLLLTSVMLYVAAKDYFRFRTLGDKKILQKQDFWYLSFISDSACFLILRKHAISDILGFASFS